MGLTVDTVAHISLLFQQRSSQFIQKVHEKKTKKASNSPTVITNAANVSAFSSHTAKSLIQNQILRDKWTPPLLRHSYPQSDWQNSFLFLQQGFIRGAARQRAAAAAAAEEVTVGHSCHHIRQARAQSKHFLKGRWPSPLIAITWPSN